MAKGEHRDFQNALVVRLSVNRIDDPIVTHPYPKTGSVLEGNGRRWPRVLRQHRYGATDAIADLGIEFAQRPERSGPELDPTGSHAQPRSTLTWSQGMLGPSSVIAAS